MKIGKIADGAAGPTITCNFHDACFSLKNGKCNAWAQNVGMVVIIIIIITIITT